MEDEKIIETLLAEVSDLHSVPQGAYNIRLNSQSGGRNSSANFEIVGKTDKPGIDIIIKPGTKNESVHIPALVTHTGIHDLVYNDFYVEDGANVTIIAGCGIHNSGCNDTRHDGIHAFHIGSNCNVTYEEKHYGEGSGTGGRILNPVTKIYMKENSVFNLDTVQIKGVDSTVRETEVEIGANSRIYVTEKLMTHDEQSAESNMAIALNGEGSSAQVISRSVAKGSSRQIFHPKAIGNTSCHAHIQCDSIIMEQANVCSIPEIDAHHVDAQIVHEAAIGRINNEQLIKLRTFGLNEEEAEAVIIDNFLN